LGIVKFYLRFAILALILALLHFLLLKTEHLDLEIKQFYIIHVFNFTMSAASYFFILFFPKLKNKTGFSFLGTSVFKMLLTMVYLGAVIIRNPNVENFALQFVFVYFIYLFYDGLIAVKRLNN